MGEERARVLRRVDGQRRRLLVAVLHGLDDRDAAPRGLAILDSLVGGADVVERGLVGNGLEGKACQAASNESRDRGGTEQMTRAMMCGKEE